MVLLVEVDGAPSIADVGFGGVTLTAPLRLTPDIEQVTPHEPFRLTRDGGNFVAQAKIRDGWSSQYRFDLAEQFEPDYEVSNWYVSHHPDSIFLKGLIAARPAPGVRCAPRDARLAIHYLNGGTERRVIADAKQLRATLEHTFLLAWPTIRRSTPFSAR